MTPQTRTEEGTGGVHMYIHILHICIGQINFAAIFTFWLVLSLPVCRAVAVCVARTHTQTYLVN